MRDFWALANELSVSVRSQVTCQHDSYCLLYMYSTRYKVSYNIQCYITM